MNIHRTEQVVRMPLMILGIVLLITAASAPPAEALRIGGSEVVVPVIAHNPGLHGTQWRTDIWINNHYSEEGPVTLTFYPENGDVIVREEQIGSYRGLFLADIVLETFGMNDAKGMLIVSAPDMRLEVHGRIFNTGDENGEFGQGFFGIPTDLLSRQGLVSGVSTAGGNRVSVGIANPTDHEITPGIMVADASDGSILYTETLTVEAHSLIQFSDIASRWNLPESSSLMINVSTSVNEDPFFAYASVVRNDTGDAIFIFGTSPNS